MQPQSGMMATFFDQKLFKTKVFSVKTKLRVSKYFTLLQEDAECIVFGDC